MMDKKRTTAKSAQPATVTCPHCRYERPAADEGCHICGYPWPFSKKAPRKRGKR